MGGTDNGPYGGLDPSAPEVIAILGALGATAGAVSAVIVYVLCGRRRRVPLNW